MNSAFYPFRGAMTRPLSRRRAPTKPTATASSATEARRPTCAGGPVDQLGDVGAEGPALEQLQVEVGRAGEDRLVPGLAGDHRVQRQLHALNSSEPTAQVAAPTSATVTVDQVSTQCENLAAGRTRCGDRRLGCRPLGVTARR